LKINHLATLAVIWLRIELRFLKVRGLRLAQNCRMCISAERSILRTRFFSLFDPLPSAAAPSAPVAAKIIITKTPYTVPGVNTIIIKNGRKNGEKIAILV
jgi:hypothetical protein